MIEPKLPPREQLVHYYALYYASLGWRIIPDHLYTKGKCTCAKKNECPSPGKHPRITDWTNKATTDEAQINQWFRDFYPRSNIGVATGKQSNIFVVDIDQKLGGKRKWSEYIEKNGNIHTPMTETGSGGYHLFLKWPKDSIITIPTKAHLVQGVGIDLRGEGGQAVLPPSYNENGEYCWVENQAPWDIEIADAPDWLLNLISSSSVESGRESERFNVVKALCGVSEGERNQALWRLAASLRASDLPQNTALTWVLQAADNCDPPYPHDEAIKAVQWAYRKFEPGTSWQNARRPYEQPIETVEWQVPVDFDEMHLPPFPIDSLPAWVKNYVEAVAETTQTPLDMAGMCSLAALATACARKVRVFVTNDWSEPLNLYTVTCAPPGSRKSAVFRHIIEPVKEHEKLIKAAKEADITRTNTEIDLLESKYRKLRSKAGSADESERAILLDEAEKTRTNINNLMKKNIAPDITADDITPQTVKTKLFEQKGRLAILSAEGDVFGMMNGRYQVNGEPDIDVYLKGHPGDDIKVNRMSGRAEDITRPALTIGICTQKKSLRGLLNKTGMSNRGLYARFLYSMAEKEFEEDTNAPPIPFKVFDVYRKNMLALLRMEYRASIEEDAESPHVLTLSSNAKELFNQFRDWVNTQCRPGGLLSTSDELKEWGAKLAGAIVRIAGILHLADLATEDAPWDFEINEETLDAARAIGGYLVTHAIAAHDQMEASISHDLARSILANIERNKKEKITKQDAVRWTKKHGQVVDNALLYLVDRGFIRDANTDGRRRGQTFEVNPKWDGTIPKENEEDLSPCPVCNGTGKRTRGKCKMCEGTGKVNAGLPTA